MSASTREKVLAALEQACREEWDSDWSRIRDCRSDESAAGYGTPTPDVAGYARVTAATVRRVLYAELNAGRVLVTWQRGQRSLRWWPVGMLARLQDEQALCLMMSLHEQEAAQ